MVLGCGCVGVFWVLAEALDLVESVGRRRGFRVERRGSVLVLRHPEAPLSVVVESRGGEVVVNLVGEGLRDFVEDVYESEEDPRGFVESILDDVTALVAEVSGALERKGFRVRSQRVREVVMDVLEMLEEVEEER